LKPSIHPAVVVLLAAALALPATTVLAQTIDFSDAEGVATGVLASLRGVFATAFFGIAFVVTGFLAAFNRISWAWVALVVVGAFLVFAGPAIVANLRAAFS
jgi:type IV secretory pathway VirB2 component (pilin)